MTGGRSAEGGRDGRSCAALPAVGSTLCSGAIIVVVLRRLGIPPQGVQRLRDRHKRDGGAHLECQPFVEGRGQARLDESMTLEKAEDVEHPALGRWLLLRLLF